MGPIVFLDFDGVLNRRGTNPPGQGRFANSAIHERKGLTWRWLDQARCALLEDALVRRVRTLVTRAEAKVVVSSDWRALLSLAEIGELLEAAGWPDPPLLGKTDPELAWSGCRRYEEVADWLRRHGEPEAWVALDDQWDDRDGLGYPVVHVDPKVGLQDGDVEKAFELLKMA